MKNGFDRFPLNSIIPAQERPWLTFNENGQLANAVVSGQVH
jgi:hypothetical protein